MSQHLDAQNIFLLHSGLTTASLHVYSALKILGFSHDF